MDLRPYVESIHRQLTVAVETAGGEAAATAERLTAAVDSTVRLALQDALVAAAEEITCELAPGSVELRLRGRDPEFVVRQPGSAAGAPGDGHSELASPNGAAPGPVAATPGDEGEGGMARVNLRLPDQLKTRAEQAAAGERLSLNAWLVKAVTAALDRAGPAGQSANPSMARRQRYVGWVR